MRCARETNTQNERVLYFLFSAAWCMRCAVFLARFWLSGELHCCKLAWIAFCFVFLRSKGNRFDRCVTFKVWQVCAAKPLCQWIMCTLVHAVECKFQIDDNSISSPDSQKLWKIRNFWNTAIFFAELAEIRAQITIYARFCQNFPSPMAPRVALSPLNYH